MMATDERKLTTSSLIPLEIDPASILSLSKGVIFDTIIHNVEYTLSNRCTDPLPWKLVGMSLICDPSRNKKYLQKLQKMQCVPSVICTHIYHSKLVKTISGVLATPGRKIILPTAPRKRLTGIIVCRSIDELLYMEPSETVNAHFVQYKLLCYERIPTRELVNGPKLSSISDKIIKTVFDFELSQNNGFPRQLLPVAIISFARQENSDLRLSIGNFLKLDDHKIFDKSYLATDKNIELNRLREEQEQKEDAEAEQGYAWERAQRREPLADLSKETTDSGNTRSSSIPSAPLRVPPLKIKVPRPEKSLRLNLTVPLPDSKFQCLIKLDRIDLSLYDISNLSTYSQVTVEKADKSSPILDSINNKEKSSTQSKLLKRLNTPEIRKSTSIPLEIAKEKSMDQSKSKRLSATDTNVSLPEDTTKKKFMSTPSPSQTYIPKQIVTDKSASKKIVKRPLLPIEYHCSIPLSRIDLSMYDLDLFPIGGSTSTSPMDLELTTTELSSDSTSFKQQAESRNVFVEQENIQDTTQSICTMERESIHQSEEEIRTSDEQSDDMNTNEFLPRIIDESLIPDINEPSSDITNQVQSSPMHDDVSQIMNEPKVTIIDQTTSYPTNVDLPQAFNECLSVDKSKIPLESTDEVVLPALNNDASDISNEENTQTSSSSLSSDLPLLEDDPVLFSLENLQLSTANTSDPVSQDCIVVIPCSDEEYEIDDTEEIINNNTTTSNDTHNKIRDSSLENSTLSNRSISQILKNSAHSDSCRLSTSSCSSISTLILQNQNLQSELRLIEILIPKKVLCKKQNNKHPKIVFNRFNLSIPLTAHTSLIDPRLIYRLQTITTDLRWPAPCDQCLVSTQMPSLFNSSTQLIVYEPKSSSNFVDPRRESLKQAILNSLYQRIKIFFPHILTMNSNDIQKFLFEQTVFKTNCSIHLEHLLHKIQITDDVNFFHMIQNQNEFQLSSSISQLIFNSKNSS